MENVAFSCIVYAIGVRWITSELLSLSSRARGKGTPDDLYSFSYSEGLWVQPSRTLDASGGREGNECCSCSIKDDKAQCALQGMNNHRKREREKLTWINRKQGRLLGINDAKLNLSFFFFFLIRGRIFAHYRKFRNHKDPKQKNIYSEYPSIHPSEYLTMYYVPSVILETRKSRKPAIQSSCSCVIHFSC